MRIIDLLSPVSVMLGAKPASKEEAIRTAAGLMVKSGKILFENEYIQGVFEREKEGTTGIGEGIAIPHCKGDSVLMPGLAAMVIPEGVDYDALDGEPVHLLFLIAAPNTEDNVHLDVLSKLSMLLMDEQFTADLKAATSIQEFLDIIDRAESSRDKVKTPVKESLKETEKSGLKLVAVTSCPTGIAHTYMAAEALEKKAIALGHTIKVETRGSGGAKNVLTDAEIAEADCVIIAADTQVPMDRFQGKPVIMAKVSDGIGKADLLIQKAESGQVPLYKGTKAAVSTGSLGEKESAGRQFYKHLMYGVSHMLPFVVGGGILIAIAYLIDSLSVDISSVADKSTLGGITEVAALFMKIGKAAFGFMLPVLAGFIAMSIADRPGLAVGFVGGFIASNGKSGFLGALIAGFIAGYLVLLLKKVFSKLPESLDGIKPVLLYPLIGVLLMGLATYYVIEPIFGTINTLLNHGLASMSDANTILLGLLLGGMMAVDLGGPVNKAAYVFGANAIATGNYNIMAAVMVGGMTPPLAIAVATLIFKSKFTLEERKAGPTNFVMGFSFISEGAIPYAAADPLHVLPALIAGSAVAGGMSMLFDCTLRAPHGGIFVFPVVGNAVYYLLALLVGTMVSVLLLGIIKRKVPVGQ